jgi:hypothetical protein
MGNDLDATFVSMSSTAVSLDMGDAVDDVPLHMNSDGRVRTPSIESQTASAGVFRVASRRAAINAAD